MTKPRMLRYTSLCLLIMVLAGLLPIQRAAAQSAPAAVGKEPAVAAAPLLAERIQERRLPSLALDVQVSAASLAVGDTATIQVAVTNQAAFPATNVVVSLPLPAGAEPADTANFNAAAGAWQWSVGRIDGRSAQDFRASVRLTSVPAGDALLARPTVSAAELTTPATGIGGALVDAPAAGGAASFKPGKAATLRAGDNRVEVRVPAGLAGDDLQLTYRTLAEKRRDSKDFQAPPAVMGFKRGFTPFFLDATDAKGRAVHQFKQPLTISVRYTPEQLQALGLDEADLAIFWYNEETRQWVPQPSTVDQDARTVSTTVDHFSAYGLGDLSSPSEAFIPSLQGWQVGLYSGSANYGMPIDVPAGAGGVKPSLELSYASTATDGKSGTNQKQQSSWVGKGWSLDTGSIALNKAAVYNNQYNHYAVVMNGMSFDLVRGAAKVGSPSPDRPSDWNWSPTDENYTKVDVVEFGDSTLGNVATGTPGRGGVHGGTPYKRFLWTIWTKDGTRFEFAEDMWWGFQECLGGVGDYAMMEAYKWQLSQVVDVHGNAITYNYAREATPRDETCFQVQGTIDRQIWPTSITWGGRLNGNPRDALGRYPVSNDRYKVEFVVGDRIAESTQFDGAVNHYGGTNGRPRETKQLNLLRVLSMPSSTWQVVREYQFGYDASLTSDYTVDTNGVYTADATHPKLTLKSITRIGKYDDPNARPSLPATTFTYGTARGATTTAYPTNGNWNRLTQVNNGQGGTVSFAYQTIEQVNGNGKFRNNRRVTSKTTTDGRGNSATWTYAYTNPAYNWLGQNITGSTSEGLHPNSATLYYAKYRTAGHDYTGTAEPFVSALPNTQFRGHSQVVETAPDGSKTEHFFHQGDVNCTPTITGAALEPATTPDPYECYFKLRDREILKGREYLTRVRTAAGALLHETEHAFKVEFLSYSSLPVLGLWRAFSYEADTYERSYEGGATPVTKRTSYSYDPAFQGGVQYGNVTHVKEYDAANVLYRSTETNYLPNTSTAYIVDRKIEEVVRNGSNHILALTSYMYDNATTSQGMGTRGLLKHVRKYVNIPAGVTTLAGLSLNSVDTSYDYDIYGNQKTVTTYAGYGTRTNNGNTWSAPGNGTLSSTTTTAYETTFNAFSTSVTSPPATAGAQPLAESATYDYRMGTMTSVTGPNGPSTAISAEYDAFGRMVKLIQPGDSSALPTIQATYADSELPFRYTIAKRIESNTAAVQTISQFYDGLGRKIQTKTETDNNATSTVVDTQYNGMSQPVREYRARLQNDTAATILQYTPTPSTGVYSTTTTYDALGRVLTTVTPDGAKSLHTYGIVGSLIYHDVVDPNRHRTQQRSDVFGRLVQVDEIKGNCGSYFAGYACVVGDASYVPWAVEASTFYTYSPLDLLTLVKDANNNQTSMTYDSLGRKLTMSDPDMGAWSYTYDVDGNLLTQTDAKNQTITFGYDNLSRMTSKAVPGSGTVTYGYDEVLNIYGSYNKGLRTSMYDASGWQTWEYNQLGQVSQETKGITDQGVTYQYTTVRDYFANGLPKTVVYPTDETLTYTYNDAGQQKTIVSSYGNSYLAGATYDALGQQLTTSYGNGTVTTNTYYATSARLYNRHVTSSGTTLFRRYYTYDTGGNVRSTDTLAAGGMAAETLRFFYDDRDRLTTACAVSGPASNTCLGGSTFNQSYAYDLIGNLTSKAGVAYTYPASGAARPHAVSTVGGQTYTYDANGNLLSGGGRTFTWNAENQPTKIVKGTTTTEDYVYDGDNARVLKVSNVNGTITRTRYVGGLLEVSGNTTISNYGGIAMRTLVGTYSLSNPGTVLYLHGDHLGSVSLTTNGATGAVVQSQVFDPWGAVRSGGITSTEFNYTGQRKDAGTGLLFYNARYYDPALGRFLQADSIVPNTSHRSLTVDYHESGFRTALSGENNQGFWFQLSGRQRQNATAPWGPGSPQELNRYSYVNNNPLRYTDPSGHKAFTRDEATALGIALSDFIHEVANQISGVTDPNTIMYLIKTIALNTMSTAGGKTGTFMSIFLSYILDLATSSTVDALLGAIQVANKINRGIISFLGSSSNTLYITFATEAECVQSPTGLHCGYIPGSAEIRMAWSTGSYVINADMFKPGVLDDFYARFEYYFGDCRPSNRSSCQNVTPKPNPKGSVPMHIP